MSNTCVGSHGRRPSRLRCAGFSLPEILVALAIFGMAVVVAAGFMSAQAASERRLAARQELLRLSEAGLESVRSGVIPLRPAVLDDPDLTDTDTLTDAAVIVDVRRGPVPDLWAVSVTVTADLRGEEVSLRTDTMVWRP